MATVRYMVKDVAEAKAFYIDHLGFAELQDFGAIAILRREDLTLQLAGPKTSAARPMPDGAQPVPGGWNRFVLEFEDLAAAVATLRGAGIVCRNDIISGPGGQQILIEDPSGNPVELFQPQPL